MYVMDEDITYYRLDLSLSRDLGTDLAEDAAVVDVSADIVFNHNETESQAGSVRGYIVRPVTATSSTSSWRATPTARPYATTPSRCSIRRPVP